VRDIHKPPFFETVTTIRKAARMLCSNPTFLLRTFWMVFMSHCSSNSYHYNNQVRKSILKVSLSRQCCTKHGTIFFNSRRNRPVCRKTSADLYIRYTL